MHPVLTLAIAVAVVLIAILRFRLHAFLALTLAALLVALLTPTEAIERSELLRRSVPFVLAEGDRPASLLVSKDRGVAAGMRFVVLREADANGGWQRVGELEVVEFGSGDAGPGVFVQPVHSESLTLSADDLVVHPLDIAAARWQSLQTVGERVAEAFGSTCGKIGILIALAAVIGKCLLDSGAADRIVRSALGVVGQRGAPAAFIFSGFLLGIPVFFDTVFYLMMPLGKAMRMRTGRNYLLYVLTIVAGATMAHSLVPPTPGPLLVSEELGVDLGRMIVAGCLVGLCSSMAGFAFATVVNRRTELPLRESADLSLADLETLAARDIRELPPLGLSLLPIVLPVVLIAGNTVADELGLASSQRQLAYVLDTIGNKNVALGIAAAIAIATLVWQKRARLRDLADSIQGALASGGVIILITAAGGAFGAMLQETGIAGLIRNLPQYSTPVVLTLAFLITTGIRTAQGSATVAMITAVGILAGFASSGTLGCDPVYLALAIGCGSKPIAWMNDSGFWVICKMSGMTESEGLRFVTPMSIIMGLSGLIVTLIAATVFPLN